MPEITTIEEARAEILRLQEQLTQTETERDTLSQNNETLSADLSRVRALNQQYFEKLSQQYLKPDEPEEPDTPSPSCEDFAKTITNF